MDRRLIIIAVLSVAIIAAVAISQTGGDDGGSNGGDSSAGGEALSTVTGELGEKPSIEPPSGGPPDTLVVNDIVEGDGAEAKAGDQVSVQYVGVTYDDGQEFDASWDRGQPFDFQLGGGQVIEGWDLGVEGMKVGGRRELVIPPGQAYGAAGSPPAIGPDATLVFVVDLVDVQN